MKAKTRIITACKQMYDEYTNYSRVVLNIPVIPNYPKVEWKAGNNPDGTHGTWIVDGRSYPGSVDEVEAHFRERTTYWFEKTRRHSEPAPKDADKAR